MSRFKKILCPIDFSETSIKVLQWSEFLAKQFGSSITVLHTIDMPLTSDPYVYDAEGAQKRADESLGNMIAPLTVKHDSLITFGDPSANIKKIADDLKADLIVMGTRGLKGLKHKFVGSTAEYVMKNSTMPVITISPVCGKPHRRLNRVLIPISEIEAIAGERNLMKVVVDELRVQVTLMHVVSYSEPMFEVKSEQLPFNAMTLETEVTRKKLIDLGKLMFESQNCYGSAVGFGDVVTEILREARTGLYDFILMSSHSERSIIPFVDSKAYNILCESEIPVITVKC